MPETTGDSLARYRRRRDFQRSAEPPGEIAAQPGRRYCIQKHAAGRLHYDFRLELEGVMKSWAVPKGPSLVAGARRLAVAVEDHPVEYGSFEGVIPEGEYGGGTVLLWDRGDWSPIGDPHRGLAKGKLEFELHGEKLRGRFALVRLRDDETQWLLMKAKDAHARAEDDGEVVDALPHSVATARDLDEIAADGGATAEQQAKARRLSSDLDVPAPAGADTLPEFVEPQLATLVDAPPAGEQWLHEIKLDGYRLLCRVEGEDITLLGRNRGDWTAKAPAVVAAVRALGLSSAFLDGELVALDDRGHTDFAALVDRLNHRRGEGLVYHVFDLLHADGVDLRDEPLLARKARLAEICARASGALRYTDHVLGRGPEFLAAASEHGLEGVMSKRADGPHRDGRGREWLKIKCRARQELVVVGYTPPKHAADRFGALVLAVREGDAWIYSGRVGTGFDRAKRADVFERLAPLHTSQCPLAMRPRGPAFARVQWVRPEVVVEVAFTQWTAEGRLRHPSFQGVRDDKPATQVQRERARATPAAAPAESRPAGVALTHPDKVLDVGTGLTKRALAEYYEAVGPTMLRYVRDRPLMLLRCPDGTTMPCFHQKHPGGSVPPGLAVFDASADADAADRMICIESATGLVGTVQMGALELHIWGSRRSHVEHPDRIVLDLDPDPTVGFAAVVAAANEVRERLADAGLVSYVMSTGGKGLHVVAPIDPVAEFSVIKAWTRALADALVRASPRQYVATASKQRRRGKIYLDYLRNGRGATAIAPYSTRARPGAPVAVPLRWEELDGASEAPRFDVAAVLQRIATGDDPWVGYDAVRQRPRVSTGVRS